MDRIEKLKSYLGKSPQDSFLRHALGLEYVKAGMETEARKAFEEVLQLDPKYVGTYYHLAKLLEKMDRQQEAINVYEKGIEIATIVGDNHARSELQNALEDIVDN